MNSYYTEVDIEKCKNRIDAIIMSQRFLPGALIGEVDFYDNKFHIRKTRPFYRNTVARFFYGELIKKENGTIIQGEFRINSFQKIPLIIFGSITAFIFVTSLLAYLSKFLLGTSIEYSSAFKSVVVPAGLLLFGLLVVKSGVEEYEENYVLELIKRTLDAEEIEK